MKFSVGLTLDKDVQSKSILVNNLFKQVNDFINVQDYGDWIAYYFISIYIINPPQGYEHLFKDFKPKFTENKIRTNRFTGEKLEIVKQFHYSIRIDGKMFIEFINSSGIECEKILATEILESLSYLDKLPKKVKDFNKEKFKTDMERFFEERFKNN